MTMIEETKTRFLERHPARTPDELREEMREAHEVKQKYSMDKELIKQNLMGFLDRLEPLIDPETDKAIAWIKRLPIKTMQELTPKKYKDMARAAENPEDLEGLLKEDTEYQDFVYTLMARLIEIPKMSPEEWGEITNPHLARLFDIKIQEMYYNLAQDISFF